LLLLLLFLHQDTATKILYEHMSQEAESAASNDYISTTSSDVYSQRRYIVVVVVVVFSTLLPHLQSHVVLNSI